MRVLLISYHFPPDAEVGAVRPYQFARLLPEHGIEPWVLTVQPQFAERPDQNFEIAGVPSSRIVRTTVGQTRRMRFIRFASNLKNSLKRRDAAGDSSDEAPVAGVPSDGHEGWLRATPFRRWLLAWLWFPDAMMGWRYPALEAAEKMLAQEKFDVIFSTSPPRVVHVIAHQLAKRHNLPWVMDLRDPWYKDTDETGSVALDRAYNALFKPYLRDADKIVLNTERLRVEVDAEWPQAASKTIAIPNGCDVKPRPAAASQPPVFAIGHYGSVYSKRDPGPFLRGLRLWLDRKKAAGEEPQIRVRFIGPEFGTTPEHIERENLSSVVTLLPPVERERVYDLMREDYALVLMANKQTVQVPGKLYEYLAARRRILATADEEGSSSDLLGQADGAVMAYSDEQVVDAIEGFWRDFQAGKPADVSNDELLDACSYKRRTALLADVLHSLKR